MGFNVRMCLFFFFNSIACNISAKALLPAIGGLGESSVGNTKL